MITLLSLHIISASVLTLTIVPLLIVAMLRRAAPFLMTSSKLSFGGTVLTGALLILANPNSLTHFCVMMTVYTIATYGVMRLYKKRVPSTALV